MSEFDARYSHSVKKLPPEQVDISTARLPLFWLAIAYTVFVIYGSLVPLNFQYHDMQWALESFKNIQYLNLGIGSRADWVANILLFIPLAFLWLGVFWTSKNSAWRIPATFLVLILSIGLCISIEFTQQFFPPRTVSLNDIYAETLGAVIGLIFWWKTGETVTRWYLGWRVNKGAADFAQRLLYAYLFILLGYNLLPLDLTISPVEIYHKWHEGKVLIVPFISGHTDFAQLFYDILTDVLIWIPAGILATLGVNLKFKQIWLRLITAAVLIEFLQLFVYSRVSDSTDIFTASFGAAIGIWLVRRWRHTQIPADHQKSSNHTAGLMLGFLFWLVLVFSVFWYPFNFNSEGAFIHRQFSVAINRVPFSLYYFGTEFRAVTEVFHKVGFFFPLGILITLLINRLHALRQKKFLVLICVALLAAALEAGQLFLPNKFADLTDWILETAGGWLGCALAWRLLRIDHLQPKQAIETLPDNHPVLSTNINHSSWLMLSVLILGGTLLLLAATHISAIPYNVRELVAQDQPIVSALLLASSVVWIFGFPVWVTIQMATGRARSAFYPVFLVIHGIVAWIILRLAVPLESIHDIVGSPILDWPWEWEMIGRFMALFALWSLVSFGAVLILLQTWKQKYGGLFWLWLASCILLLPVSYYVVIQQAATDNIYELLDGGGSPMAFLWITTGTFILAFAGTFLARTIGSGFRVGVLPGLVISMISIPLSYFVLNAGLEYYIVKYDQVFSAFQFLLSQDRAHYASHLELLLRYGLAHIVLLFAIAICQTPFFMRPTGSIENTSKSSIPPQRRKHRTRRTA